MDERLRVKAKNRAVCELCGDVLDIGAVGVFQWTAGWVALRSGGGGHGVSCPVRESRWAHGTCVRSAAAGKLNQGALF